MPEPRHENETTEDQILEAIRVLENQSRFALPHTKEGYLWCAKSLRLDLAQDRLMVKYMEKNLIPMA